MSTTDAPATTHRTGGHHWISRGGAGLAALMAAVGSVLTACSQQVRGPQFGANVEATALERNGQVDQGTVRYTIRSGGAVGDLRLGVAHSSDQRASQAAPDTTDPAI